MNVIEAARNFVETRWKGEIATGRSYADDANQLDQAVKTVPVNAVAVDKHHALKCATTLIEAGFYALGEKLRDEVTAP